MLECSIEENNLSLNENPSRRNLWIKGDVINAFVTNILHPKFSNRKVHFSSSYFFSKLLGTGPTGTLPPVYNFHEVRRWGNKLRGNIFGRKELIIPLITATSTGSA
jgi:hypothetical protein